MIATEWTEYPTCPYCGEVDQDWWDGCGLDGDGAKDTTACPSCGKKYKRIMCLETTFTTEKIEEQGE